VVDVGQVVASLELDAGGFLGGMEAAIEAAQALGGRARGASVGIAQLSGAMGALKGAAEQGMVEVPIEGDLCFGKKFIGKNLFPIHLDDAGGLC